MIICITTRVKASDTVNLINKKGIFDTNIDFAKEFIGVLDPAKTLNQMAHYLSKELNDLLPEVWEVLVSKKNESKLLLYNLNHFAVFERGDLSITIWFK